MLDYAANATKYWPIDQLRRAAEETAGGTESLDRAILALLGAEDPLLVEGFWQTVEQNLRDGHLRMLFVGDAIPAELRRITEFLNTQMESVEVLAVEVKQFVGDGGAVMVPRVLGMTEATRERKERTSGPSRRPRPWTPEELEKTWLVPISRTKTGSRLAASSPSRGARGKRTCPA